MTRDALMGGAAMPAPSPDALLLRDQAAKALTEEGFKTSKSTLATLAVRGGGPVFRKFGTRPLYKWADLLAWAESKTSAPRRSTSEPLTYNASI
jgi:hypothetical protein